MEIVEKAKQLLFCYYAISLYYESMADQAAGIAVQKALSDSYNAGGRAELANFYASDAIYMCPGEVKVTGREGKDKYYNPRSNL